MLLDCWKEPCFFSFFLHLSFRTRENLSKISSGVKWLLKKTLMQGYRQSGAYWNLKKHFSPLWETLIHSRCTCLTKSAPTACCTPGLILELRTWVRWLHKHFVKKREATVNIKVPTVNCITASVESKPFQPPTTTTFLALFAVNVLVADWTAAFSIVTLAPWQNQWQYHR